MGKNFIKDNWRILLFSSIISVIAVIAVSLILNLMNDSEPNKNPVAKTENENSISEYDVLQVENNTESFLSYFLEGNPLNEQKYIDITFDFFKPEFLENDFSDQKSFLFGLYGFEQLTHTYTTVEGLEREGGISSYEIEDIQKDNANQTITTYIIMDSLKPNTSHWIEWRSIPGEGWKINALSFHGNIESLENPLSPKKQL